MVPGTRTFTRERMYLFSLGFHTPVSRWSRSQCPISSEMLLLLCAKAMATRIILGKDLSHACRALQCRSACRG